MDDNYTKYTVKKIYAGDEQDGRFLSPGYAVVGQDGKIVVDTDYAGRKIYSIFKLRMAASQEADYLNRMSR